MRRDKGESGPAETGSSEAFRWIRRGMVYAKAGRSSNSILRAELLVPLQAQLPVPHLGETHVCGVKLSMVAVVAGALEEAGPLMHPRIVAPVRDRGLRFRRVQARNTSRDQPISRLFVSITCISPAS